jgi:hypothetical protein
MKELSAAVPAPVDIEELAKIGRHAEVGGPLLFACLFRTSRSHHRVDPATAGCAAAVKMVMNQVRMQPRAHWQLYHNQNQYRLIQACCGHGAWSTFRSWLRLAGMQR